MRCEGTGRKGEVLWRTWFDEPSWPGAEPWAAIAAPNASRLESWFGEKQCPLRRTNGLDPSKVHGLDPAENFSGLWWPAAHRVYNSPSACTFVCVHDSGKCCGRFQNPKTTRTRRAVLPLRATVLSYTSEIGYAGKMDGLERLDQFDLGKHGDRHEREFWPLLSSRFPSYESLWRQLIVPLTQRIDPKGAGSPDTWIRPRPGIPEKYETVSMAHYSVFYFLGRAVKRFKQEETALEYPEDVFFLLDSVGDNFKHFRRAMNDLGADCGRPVFKAPLDQVPPFKEISDYRDTFLHNTVIGLGVEGGKTYIPKWNPEKAVSPLERAKRSWSAAEQLSRGDLVSTSDLLERLIQDVCRTLEGSWQQALAAVRSQPFQQKMMKITRLADYLPLEVPAARLEWGQPSGGFSSLGSNTTFAVYPASGNYSAKRSEPGDNG